MELEDLLEIPTQNKGTGFFWRCYSNGETVSLDIEAKDKNNN